MAPSKQSFVRCRTYTLGDCDALGTGALGKLCQLGGRALHDLPAHHASPDRPWHFAGAFLAFVASMDNVPVSFFLSSARTDMLPIRIWGMMENTLDVRVASASGVLTRAILVLMFVMDRLTA